MPEGEQAAEPAPEPHAAGTAENRSWLSRKSIGARRRQMEREISQWREFDRRDNDESRLPPAEEVCLGGLVLAEVFTPSTASSLRKALAEFPENNGRKTEWLTGLEEGRSATGSGGWQNLGVVRRPGEFGMDSFDPEIPDAIDAVWPSIFYLTSSLTVVVATFALKDEEGDLSSLLRADYLTSASRPKIHMQGRFGHLRRHIPWTRPKNFKMWQSLQRAENNKMLACESAISSHEEASWSWFSRRFPGIFSSAGRENRPTVRILLTQEKVPFEDYHRQFAPVGLSSVLDVWDSTNQPGWKLTFRNRPRDSRFALTVAARSRDAAQSPGGDISGDSTWHLTQTFATNQSSLVARWAIVCLLSLYTYRLASLRDRAGRPRKMAKPIRQARDFDKFLITDGLDASTIISDLDVFVQNVNRFRSGVAEYSEHLSRYPESYRNTHKPEELVPNLCGKIKNHAGRLKQDMEAATSNIAASAGLRQAIANTRLQRSVIVLTLVAIIIALASLYVSIHPSGGSLKPGPSPAAKPSQVSSSHIKHLNRNG